MSQRRDGVWQIARPVSSVSCRVKFSEALVAATRKRDDGDRQGQGHQHRTPRLTDRWAEGGLRETHGRHGSVMGRIG